MYPGRLSVAVAIRDTLPASWNQVAEREDRRMASSDVELEILLPVHNEAASIEATLREIFQALSRHATCRFIVCEDGSVDNTRQVLQQCSAMFPMTLITSPGRKGYSRAVIDGMQAMRAPFLLCLDSDGQCDPDDFAQFWADRRQADLIIGWRVHRADHWVRRYLSGFFQLVYRLFYKVPIHDPSCPFVLVPQTTVQALLPQLGAMEQGFWWEFVARAYRHRLQIRELPIRHRARAAGETKVYTARKLPGIGWRHLLALFTIWKQTRNLSDKGPARGTNAEADH
jgi:glycosyltransferase involved in cell wall biosynthesis